MLRSSVARLGPFVRCVRVPKAGSAEVLELADYPVDTLSLKPNQVLVRNTWAGVNFIDTYYRGGLYPLPPSKSYPYIPGDEGAGSVVQTGPEVDDSWKGKRVCYFSSVEGSYSSFSVANVGDLIEIPEKVPDDCAAAMILQSLTAHYLCHDCFACKPGSVVVVHAAAGGTGLCITQIARLRGATVIGICGGHEKAHLARTVGQCQHVIDYTTLDWVREIKHIAPDGVDAVYDGVGAATFKGSLSLLKPRGHMISFGNASGAVPPIAPLELTKQGSVTLQRPSLKHFMNKGNGEFDARVKDVFEWNADGRLKIVIGRKFTLQQARAAHEFLESKKSLGKVLINCQE